MPRLLNISHVIHHVSFGPHYPGLVNPLDGFVRTVGKIPQTFKYFLKVVPTEFYSRTGVLLLGVGESPGAPVSSNDKYCNPRCGSTPIQSERCLVAVFVYFNCHCLCRLEYTIKAIKACFTIRTPRCSGSRV